MRIYQEREKIIKKKHRGKRKEQIFLVRKHTHDTAH